MSSNELFEVRRRRSVGEINIVPILDMLTTIIFFLLISASFLQFNKIAVPPSKTSLLDQSDTPPLQPRMLLAKSGNEQKLILFWTGNTPGSYIQSFPLTADKAEISAKAQEFAKNFNIQFKDEKAIQVGLGPDLPYGNLVALMDAVRNYLPSVVLISYQDTQAASDRLLDPKAQNTNRSGR